MKYLIHYFGPPEGAGPIACFLYMIGFLIEIGDVNCGMYSRVFGVHCLSVCHYVSIHTCVVYGRSFTMSLSFFYLESLSAVIRRNYAAARWLRF